MILSDSAVGNLYCGAVATSDAFKESVRFEKEDLLASALEKIVPWGRSCEEYRRMFNLSAEDLQSSILDCAGGPSSFNAEMHDCGHVVVSCDPIYRFSPAEISSRIEETHQTILDGIVESRDNFVWQEI